LVEKSNDWKIKSVDIDMILHHTYDAHILKL